MRVNGNKGDMLTLWNNRLNFRSCRLKIIYLHAIILVWLVIVVISTVVGIVMIVNWWLRNLLLCYFNFFGWEPSNSNMILNMSFSCQPNHSKNMPTGYHSRQHLLTPTHKLGVFGKGFMKSVSLWWKNRPDKNVFEFLWNVFFDEVDEGRVRPFALNLYLERVSIVSNQ